MKRILAIALIVILFAIVLAYCVSKTNTDRTAKKELSKLTTSTTAATTTAVKTTAITTTGTNGEIEIFNNGNVYGVYNNPTSPTTFTVDKAYTITFIMDYHYYNNGVLPGTIALKHDDGTIYGPWQTKGREGQGGVNNAYWDSAPNVQVKAGTYTVIDSDTNTWSQNTQSGNSGITIIKGISAN